MGTLDGMTFHNNSLAREGTSETRLVWGIDHGSVIRRIAEYPVNPGVAVVEVFGLSWEVFSVIDKKAINADWSMMRVAYDEQTLILALTYRCRGRVISTIREIFETVKIVAEEANPRATLRLSWDQYLYIWVGEAV